jgi:hypothetical protein
VRWLVENKDELLEACKLALYTLIRVNEALRTDSGKELFLFERATLKKAIENAEGKNR